MSETATNWDVWGICSCGTVKRASRQLSLLYDDVLAPSGMRGTQFTLLAQIRASGAPAMRELAEAMVMDLSALGHTLKPLARDGLISLTPDSADRRVKRVALTPLGIARHDAAIVLWREAQRRIDTLLGADRAALLRDLLNEVSTPTFADRFHAG